MTSVLVAKRKSEKGDTEGEKIKVTKVEQIDSAPGGDENVDANVRIAASLSSKDSKLAAEASKDKVDQPEAQQDAQAEAPTAREVAAAEAARKRLEGGPQAAGEASLEGRLPTGPEPAASDIEYIPSEELKPVADVKAKLAGLPDKLGSKDWIVACKSLNTMRQLAIHHCVDTEPQMGSLAPLVLKLLKSPRSQIIKTAVMCMADLFRHMGTTMLGLLNGDGAPGNSMLYQLLLKASSKDKKFVIEETERTVCVMAEALDATPLAELLLPYAAHKSPLVRAKAVVALSKVVQRMGNGAAEFGLERLLKTAGTMISDKMQDARDASKDLLGVLHAAHAASFAPREAGEGEEDSPALREPQAAWSAMCRKELEATVANSVLKLTGGSPEEAA